MFFLGPCLPSSFFLALSPCMNLAFLPAGWYVHPTQICLRQSFLCAIPLLSSSHRRSSLSIIRIIPILEGQTESALSPVFTPIYNLATCAETTLSLICHFYMLPLTNTSIYAYRFQTSCPAKLLCSQFKLIFYLLALLHLEFSAKPRT